jgi:hypothetical protein
MIIFVDSLLILGRSRVFTNRDVETDNFNSSVPRWQWVGPPEVVSISLTVHMIRLPLLVISLVKITDVTWMSTESISGTPITVVKNRT